MYCRAILQILPKWHFLNNRVCFSHVLLKENFQKTLEVIRGSNKALKFCGILINAKEVVQESESLYPPVEISVNKDELVAHSIICELKEFIHKDKPEYILVDTILKSLKNSSNETRHQLISLLFSIGTVNFLNPKSQSSKEYLKYFINEFESFFRNADKDHCFWVSDIQGDLKMLETILFRHSEDYVLDLMYRVHSAIFDEGHHSDDHHRKIEALMSDAVSLILTRLLQLNIVSKPIIEKCLYARGSTLVIDKVDSKLTRFYLEQISYCYHVLDEVPLYYMTKKERLVQYLKNTNSSNNACEFFGLLNSINTLKLDTNSNKESLNWDSIMIRLKDIIHAEKPEYNVIKFILLPLQNRTNHLKELSELLSHFFPCVDNFDHEKKNSEECLMCFIQEFERLIRLYGSNSFMCKSTLKSISDVSESIRKYCTADLQKAILHNYQSHFFGEEKKMIGFLMVEAITPMEKFIYSNYNGKVSDSILRSLSQRSAFQYIKEFLDSFPVNETPLKPFDVIRIDRCIQKLDRHLEFMYPEDEETENCFIDYDDFEEEGAYAMPKSHVWWAKYSQFVTN